MYAQDTFFHLSIGGQIGLGLLSIILAVSTLLLYQKISIRFGISVKVLLALVFIWGFIWLSPQVYYLYYLLLFENLPLQWVIQPPPGIKLVLKTVFFMGDANLSQHFKGLLFWLMFGLNFVKPTALQQ